MLVIHNPEIMYNSLRSGEFFRDMPLCQHCAELENIVGGWLFNDLFLSLEELIQILMIQDKKYFWKPLQGTNIDICGETRVGSLRRQKHDVKVKHN